MVNEKSFFGRWAQGIKDVTPYQSARITYHSNYLIILGILLGIGINVVNEVWWLVIVLSGALVITSLGQLGTRQKLLLYKKIEGGVV